MTMHRYVSSLSLAAVLTWTLLTYTGQDWRPVGEPFDTALACITAMREYEAHDQEEKAYIKPYQCVKTGEISWIAKPNNLRPK